MDTNVDYTVERSKKRVRQPPSDICVVGLGYVGLPIAVAFDRVGYDVIGFDIDNKKIDQLRSGIDPTGDVGGGRVKTSEVQFTADETAIERSRYVIVTVPTPIDDLKNPNLTYVESAGETIGRNITPGTTVVLESTVYPGATREILAPAIERTSGLIAGDDFYLGYSPERLVPGDEENGFRNVVKIVSGQNAEVLEDLSNLYETVVDAGVHKAPDIEVAEAAKCIENIQRDLNIALVNELAITCNNLDLDTHAVLEAAGTKWNFHDYRPGLVGGHCIPVDPFYIIYESERNGFSPKLIQQGREINEYMPKHVGKEVLKALNECGNVLRESVVLVLGLAYKPNVGDIRTSAVDGTIQTLQEYSVDVVGYDPHVDEGLATKMFDIDVQRELIFDAVDAILFATPHDEFRNIDFTMAATEMTDNPILIDVMGVLTPERYENSTLEYRRI
ncbi:nucleotide sugar dehydrogenase [Halorubraceae archaeon YAN]|nr:nucleotide sugar dehydrogenase [Halorubraceae archaeon YAN]